MTAEDKIILIIVWNYDANKHLQRDVHSYAHQYGWTDKYKIFSKKTNNVEWKINNNYTKKREI